MKGASYPDNKLAMSIDTFVKYDQSEFMFETVAMVRYACHRPQKFLGAA
jgi:hypothetical protein